MSTSRRSRSLTLALALAGALAACRTSAPDAHQGQEEAGLPGQEAPRERDRIALPRFELATRDYAGAPLRGILPKGAAAALDAEPSRAQLVRVRVLYLERALDLGVPLDRASRLIASRAGDAPLQPTARLAMAARRVDPDELAAALARAGAPRRRVCAEFTSALLGGATREVALEAGGGRAGPSTGIELARAAVVGAPVELAVRFEADVEVRDEDAEGAPPRRMPWSELVLLDAALDAAHPRATLHLPDPFSPPSLGPRGAFVVDIELVADAPERAQLVAAALEGARAAERSADERAARVEEREARAKERRNALESLALAPNRRAALVFLAGATRASFCGDLALVADDAALVELVDALTRDAGSNDALAGDETALGWHLERGAWVFVEAKLGGDGAVPAELSGLALRRAGEVARSSGAIEDLLATSRSARELEARFVEENLAYLEDVHPAARVRAFDWLAARGVAPEGYDPLGSREERARALERAAEEKEVRDGASLAPEEPRANAEGPR
ncbi:MAG: hypothetical protein IPJ77_22025 [Planctomycetes bacterium]|nr:hypothetical protein [Planctomycetota bacterium]